MWSPQFVKGIVKLLEISHWNRNPGHKLGLKVEQRRETEIIILDDRIINILGKGLLVSPSEIRIRDLKSIYSLILIYLFINIYQIEEKNLVVFLLDSPDFTQNIPYTISYFEVGQCIIISHWSHLITLIYPIFRFAFTALK